MLTAIETSYPQPLRVGTRDHWRNINANNLYVEWPTSQAHSTVLTQSQALELAVALINTVNHLAASA